MKKKKSDTTKKIKQAFCAIENNCVLVVKEIYRCFTGNVLWEVKDFI